MPLNYLTPARAFPANKQGKVSCTARLLIDLFPDSCFVTMDMPLYILILPWPSHSALSIKVIKFHELFCIQNQQIVITVVNLNVYQRNAICNYIMSLCFFTVSLLSILSVKKDHFCYITGHNEFPGTPKRNLSIRTAKLPCKKQNTNIHANSLALEICVFLLSSNVYLLKYSYTN